MVMLHGSCLCGAVSFTDAISITAGRDLLTTYQPAEGSRKTFCGICGSNLFGGGWPESERSSIRLPTFDTPFDSRPRRHIYTRSVASRESLPEDDLPRIEQP